MKVSLKENGQEVFFAYGIEFGGYFIGIGGGDNSKIEAAGLVWLFWMVYVRVPYKYRQKIRAWRKEKPKDVVQSKRFRVDLHLWEQRIGIFWKYSLWGKKPKYTLFKIKPNEARYLRNPTSNPNAR